MTHGGYTHGGYTHWWPHSCINQHAGQSVSQSVSLYPTPAREHRAPHVAVRASYVLNPAGVLKCTDLAIFGPRALSNPWEPASELWYCEYILSNESIQTLTSRLAHGHTHSPVHAPKHGRPHPETTRWARTIWRSLGAVPTASRALRRRLMPTPSPYRVYARACAQERSRLVEGAPMAVPSSRCWSYSSGTAGMWTSVSRRPEKPFRARFGARPAGGLVHASVVAAHAT